MPDGFDLLIPAPTAMDIMSG